MSDPSVLFTVEGSVARVTLNRPQSLNSVTRDMHSRLWDVFDRIEADSALRALVITGAGRGFCAGADLSQFDFAPGPGRAERIDPRSLIEEAFNPTTRRLQALRVPTVAAVNGIAAGAGASLVMACDLAIAAPTAAFVQAFSKIGLVPDAGGTWFLVKRMGLARAMGAAMLGDRLSAQDAKAWGMIWDVAPVGTDCLTMAMALAQRLALMPTRALVETRHALRGAAARELDAQLDVERDVQSMLSRTHDYTEGVTAFLAKRTPQFRGN